MGPDKIQWRVLCGQMKYKTNQSTTNDGTIAGYLVNKHIVT